MPEPQGHPWVPAAFWLLATINVLVGGMVGLDRTVAPLLGRDAFGPEAGGALAAALTTLAVRKEV